MHDDNLHVYMMNYMMIWSIARMRLSM